MPEASRMLELGQCATPVPAAPRRAISASSKWMPCPNQVRDGQPADAVQVVDRAQPEHLPAEVLLVDGLGEMGVQPYVVVFGQRRGVAHDLAGDREGRARGQSDLDHRARTALVVGGDQALGVGQDHVRHPARCSAAAARRHVRPASSSPGSAAPGHRAGGRPRPARRSPTPSRRGTGSGDRPPWCTRTAAARPGRRWWRARGLAGSAAPRPGRGWSATGTAGCSPRAPRPG